MKFQVVMRRVLEIVALALLLANNAPRERSGSRNSNRVGFQHDWTLCKVLELHESAEPYAVVCDYHDDVLVLNDEDDPTEARPIQVKTGKNSPWTVTALFKTKAGKSGVLPSYIGKLYLGCSAFSQSVPELRFVTTAAFNLKLASETSSDSLPLLKLEDLHPDLLSEMVEKLQKEIPNFTELNPPLVLERSSLSLQDHSTHVKGVLTNFLEKLYPGAPVRVNAAYQALASEIVRLTNQEDPISSFSELIAKKGMSRTKFELILRQIPKVDPVALWETAKRQLQSDGVTFPAIAKLSREWKQYEADRTDFSDIALQQERERIATLFRSMPIDESAPTLVSFIDQALLSSTLNGRSHTYKQAMAILEYYEQELSPIDSQPKKEA